MTAAELLDRFKKQRIVVIGDVMLDAYIFGEATRISQEAPVMVVRQQRSAHVPGGAANVARNLKALGAEVDLVGVVGDDLDAKRLRGALVEAEIAHKYLLTDPGRSTTAKTRVLANHSHQVLRIDCESSEILSEAQSALLLKMAFEAIDSADAVLVSDYAKGALSSESVRAIIAYAAKTEKPVVANPKPKTALSYAGAKLVSLNRYEAASSLGVEALSAWDAPDAATRLRTMLSVDSVVVTLGGDGLAISSPQGALAEPAVKVDVYDEAGAGDTAIATLALCAATGELGRMALWLAARTAGAVVKKVGVASPSEEDLALIRSQVGP